MLGKCSNVKLHLQPVDCILTLSLDKTRAGKMAPAGEGACYHAQQKCEISADQGSEDATQESHCLTPFLSYTHACAGLNVTCPPLGPQLPVLIGTHMGSFRSGVWLEEGGHWLRGFVAWAHFLFIFCSLTAGAV